MNGANSQFVSAPDFFLTANVVNNISWFQQAGIPQASHAHSAIMMANSAKEACFDLVRTGKQGGMRVYDLTITSSHIQNDGPILAYWCPFYQGNQLPGFVDVPFNPTYQLVLTPAMNGCAFFITASPYGPAYFRVYHNQHPDSGSVNQMIHATSGGLLSSFTFHEYGNSANPNGFNLLHFSYGQWWYVSQPQTFIIEPHGFGVGFRPGGQVTKRPVFG